MELLVCSRFTSRLYAEIPAKRAEDRKALDRLSHIRHTSTVFTLLIVDKTVVQYREKERQKGKKDLKGLLKRIFKGFWKRTDYWKERERRNDRTTLKCRIKGILQGSGIGCVLRRLQRVIPLCLWEITRVLVKKEHE